MSFNNKLYWEGNEADLCVDDYAKVEFLKKNEEILYVVSSGDKIGVSNKGNVNSDGKSEVKLEGIVNFVNPGDLGDNTFCKDYGIKAPYMGGAMANGISSKEMVVALGKNGFLGSFGSGGESLENIEKAIKYIQKELPNGPYAFNLLHNHGAPVLEEAVVDLYIKYGIKVVEAAAYINLSPALAYYRISGLKKDTKGEIIAENKVIAKISRREVAEKFLQPPSELIIKQLLSKKMITPEQAEMAKYIPMADDITVEADSGGHTDNRPLVSLLPSIIAVRDQMMEKFKFSKIVRVGAAGGISTPQSALGAFMMGAAYVVTGSVNQSCIESGTTDEVKQLLSKAEMADVTMTPSSDMFELGGKVQVLKKGTMYPMVAQKLYEIYRDYDSIQDIPDDILQKIVEKHFKKDVSVIWSETVEFFKQRDPSVITKAEKDPKKKMALIFRWYLGQSSRWAHRGEKSRMMDWQIWCGQAMGAFNNWVKGSYLEDPKERKVADVAMHIMQGAAFYFRVRMYEMLGGVLPSDMIQYVPDKANLG